MALISRRMRKADLDAVAALEAAAFSRPWLKEDFEKCLEMEERIYFVAEDDGVTVGVAGLICSPPEAELLNVSVDVARRRRGIAEGLLKSLMAEGEKSGIDAVVLEVRESNKPARTLYEKLGFKEEGRIKKCYSDPTEDGLVYWYRKES